MAPRGQGGGQQQHRKHLIHAGNHWGERMIRAAQKEHFKLEKPKKILHVGSKAGKIYIRTECAKSRAEGRKTAGDTR